MKEKSTFEEDLRRVLSRSIEFDSNNPNHKKLFNDLIDLVDEFGNEWYDEGYQLGLSRGQGWDGD